MGTLLFTSLPPQARHADYQEACVTSWRSAGFIPISVNSSTEAVSSGIRRISINRDASALVKKPLVLLSDLMHAAIEESSGKPFAIVNSDILLAPTFDLEEIVAKLPPGATVFSRRIDIDEPGKLVGEAYFNGFDFFAMNRRDPIPHIGMVFGMPWWDHFLPIISIASGQTHQIRAPFAFHVKHPAYWDQRLLAVFGQKLFDSLNLLGSRYARFVRYWIFRERMCFWRKAPFFERLSAANIEYIDRNSAPMFYSRV